MLNDLGIVQLIAIAAMVYIPWLVTMGWWYIALFYYLCLHREEIMTTDDFTIKILTIGKEQEVLSKTVSYCAKEPIIISRVPVTVPRGIVRVLPPDFGSAARYKAQQLEWARRTYPGSYTLFLDEDSLCSFERIPAGDVVQFQEVPVSSRLLVEAAEAYRMGFQIEQALFEKTGPLFLWGGGVAISQEMENATTWDRPTITEDTAFIFATRRRYRFKFSKLPIYAQAPLTLRDLIRQRWRWSSGTFRDGRYLPFGPLKVLVYFRTLQWGLWPLGIALPALVGVSFWLTVPLTIQTLIWSFAGTRIMGLGPVHTLLVLLVTPAAAVIHSLGATLALVKPKKAFVSTPKTKVQVAHP